MRILGGCVLAVVLSLAAPSARGEDEPDPATAKADAAKWLDQLGDPYTRTGADVDGRVGIDWGVYGVPETFIVDKRGIIRHKIIGAVTREKLDRQLLPLVRRLQAE